MRKGEHVVDHAEQQVLGLGEQRGWISQQGLTLQGRLEPMRAYLCGQRQHVACWRGRREMVRAELSHGSLVLRCTGEAQGRRRGDSHALVGLLRALGQVQELGAFGVQAYGVPKVPDGPSDTVYGGGACGHRTGWVPCHGSHHQLRGRATPREADFLTSGAPQEVVYCGCQIWAAAMASGFQQGFQFHRRALPLGAAHAREHVSLQVVRGRSDRFHRRVGGGGLHRGRCCRDLRILLQHVRQGEGARRQFRGSDPEPFGAAPLPYVM